MRPYVFESGKSRESMRDNKSSNYKCGKFNVSRNRMKKALKSRARQRIKKECRLALAED